jgi:hypothetical protein
MLAIFGFMLPNLSHAFMSQQIMGALPDIENCDHQQVATAGYSEPSLVFDAGQDTRFLNVGERLAVEMKRNPCLIGVVEAGQKEEFLQKAPKFQLKPQYVSSVSGFNYGAGKMVMLDIYRTAPEKQKPKKKSRRIIKQR